MYRSMAIRGALKSTGSRSTVTALPRASSAAWRAASTRNPVPGSSGPPNAEDAARYQLAPGEEIDPQLQGYPQLPFVSNQKRPAKGWWDPQNRRNFGEVMHEEADLLGMFGPDVPNTTAPRALAQITASIAAVCLFVYVVSFALPEREAIPREYPYNGLEKEYGGEDASWHPPAEQERDDDE